ncbi:MAG: M1 family metallopeptidase [Acidobacteriia bacterium]|nr:M1 family metallopeptidase [Terriglobia bacterium]
MKPYCLLFLGMTLSMPPAFADTYPRQPGVDAQHYIFRLTLRDDTDEISGEATAVLLFVKEGVTQFALDLASPVNGKGMNVSEVTSGGGSPVLHSHTGDRLVISPAIPPKAGERRQFTVRYHGVPNSFTPAAGLRIGTNKFGERTFFSLNWPDRARQWLPIIDHPYDKATSEFWITAPAKYQVVANGLLEEETDLGDGNRLTHWKQSVPIASWLNAIGVAQFASRHFGTAAGVPLETWVFHQDRDPGIVTFEVPTRQAIEFYSDHVGRYPYEKLAAVEAAGLGGGTEHASAIFYGQASVTNRPATGLVAHEIAHQWFGDSITEKDWDDVWLSEGFATYFTLLSTEQYEGRDAFVAGLKRSRDRVLAIEKQNPGMAVLHNNLSDMSKVLNQIVYQKGAWVLHMLRAEIGTEKFWAGIRDYYRRYRDSSASTADFRAVMEEDSGMDLGWLFDQWLRRPGSPVVEGTWRYNPGSQKVEVDLAQTQPGDAYRLPLEVGVSVDGARQPKIEKLVLAEKRRRFEIAAGKEPEAVVLDPNTWVLMTAKFDKR